MAWWNDRDFRALNRALANDELDEVRRLIGNGVDVNKRDTSGRRPLDLSTILEPCYDSPNDAEVSSRHQLRLQKAKLLLASGADPNLHDAGGWCLVHQCAHTGDLALLRTIVRKGAKVTVHNNQGYLPVEQAFQRGHAPLVRFLEQQSCDLRSLCRLVIREAMGKRSYHRLNELPLPPSIKLFLNYGSPYQGFSATVIPERPWTSEQLHSGNLAPADVCQFMRDHATRGFLEQHTTVMEGRDLQGLVEAFESMYLWESFKSIGYEEPAARPPCYSLEKREGGEAEEGSATT